MSDIDFLSAAMSSPTSPAGNTGVGRCSLRPAPAAFSFTHGQRLAISLPAHIAPTSTAHPSDAATNISKIMTALLVGTGATMLQPWRVVIPNENKNCAGTG